MTDMQRIEATVGKLRAEMAEAQGRATHDEVDAALKVASAQIDAMFQWKGEKADPQQPMAWPRKGVVDASGQPVTGVPERVQDATYFLAGYRLMGKKFGGGDHAQERDVITYLLILVNGLTDPKQPMRAPR